jgi:septal ring-binding cell division protein DamX
VQTPAAKSAPAALVSAAPATVKAAEPKATATRQQEPQAAAVAAPVVTAQSTAIDGAALENAGPFTHARMAATAAWLKDAPGREFAIQVMTVSTGNQRELEAFLARADKLTGLNNIYVYQTRVKGQSKTGLAVVYGSYPSREKVRETIAQFPAEIRTYLPYLRTVDGIRREIAERDGQASGRT